MYVSQACHYAIIKTVIKDNSIGKIPLGKLRLRWEEFVRRRDVKPIDPRTDCEEAARDRD